MCGQGTQGSYLVPIHFHNNKVNMFIIFAPKLVLEKNIRSDFREMSGRVQDPLLCGKFSVQGVQNPRTKVEAARLPGIVGGGGQEC